MDAPDSHVHRSTRTRRPLGVSLLAIFHMLACLLFLPISGFVLAQLLLIPDRSTQIGTGIIALLVLGFSMFLNGHLGYGLWTLQPPIYRLALGFYILVLIGQMMSIMQHAPITFAPIISVLVILYLLRPHTRTFFQPNKER